MSQEIETFYRILKNCPKCRSSEGFWLGTKSRVAYLQCKHCGTIFEIAEMITIEQQKKKEKKHGQLLRKIHY